MCYIGRHIKMTGFVVLTFELDADVGVYFMTGPVNAVSNQEIEDSGLSITLSKLRNTAVSRLKELTAERKISEKDLAKIKQKYVLVSVELLKSNIEEMKMIPLHAGRGWQFDVLGEEVRLFPLPASNDEFMQRLNEALELAS